MIDGVMRSYDSIPTNRSAGLDQEAKSICLEGYKHSMEATAHLCCCSLASDSQRNTAYAHGSSI